MIRNANVRWNEHESGIDKNAECFKDLQEHFKYEFQCSGHYYQ